MNKSDIMKAAAVAKDINEHYWSTKDTNLCNPNTAIICEALVAAAELLKQVEVLPEGEKAQKNDVIDLGEFGFAIVTAVSGNNIDCAMLRDGQLTSGYFFRNFGKYQIIQRAGKPVIVEKEGV